MTVKLLCAADFHLGRRPTRLPDDLERQACSPLAAWERLIRLALRERPQAVLLAGDIIDFDNRFYETLGHLEHGARQLIGAGIPLYAVAGNHDFSALPQMAAQLDGFHLLGADGRWETGVIEADGRPVALVQGWSFPRNHVTDNPLLDYHPPERIDLPVIGLLHCETAQADSVYAPTPPAQLRLAGPGAWVLGHRHAPQVLEKEQPLIFYCGSPQGLHPNETGPHGAWLLEIDDARLAAATPVPLAGLRWEHLETSLDAVVDEETFRQALIASLNDLHRRTFEADEPTIAVGCRLTLHGRSPFHRQIEALRAPVAEDLRRRLDGRDYFIEQLDNRVKAAFSLSDIARHNDPPGLLARRLLLLEEKQPPEEYTRLIDEARQRLAAVQNAYYSGGVSPDLSGEELREQLLAAGYDALETLFAQKAERP